MKKGTTSAREIENIPPATESSPVAGKLPGEGVNCADAEAARARRAKGVCMAE